MADPLLDERLILTMLNVPVSLEVAARLQHASLMALVDAYDRKLERESYIALAGAALELHSAAGKYKIMSSIAALQKDNKLTVEEITSSQTELDKHATKLLSNLTALFERCAMCPTSEDKVH